MEIFNYGAEILFQKVNFLVLGNIFEFCLQIRIQVEIFDALGKILVIAHYIMNQRLQNFYQVSFFDQIAVSMVIGFDNERVVNKILYHVRDWGEQIQSIVADQNSLANIFRAFHTVNNVSIQIVIRCTQRHQWDGAPIQHVPTQVLDIGSVLKIQGVDSKFVVRATVDPTLLGRVRVMRGV